MARPKGSKNKATLEIREALAGDEKTMLASLRGLMTCADPSVAFQALKLALAYRFGQPRQHVEGKLEGEFVVRWDNKK